MGLFLVSVNMNEGIGQRRVGLLTAVIRDGHWSLPPRGARRGYLWWTTALCPLFILVSHISAILNGGSLMVGGGVCRGSWVVFALTVYFMVFKFFFPPFPPLYFEKTTF